MQSFPFLGVPSIITCPHNVFWRRKQMGAVSNQYVTSMGNMAPQVVKLQGNLMVLVSGLRYIIRRLKLRRIIDNHLN